MEPRSSDGASFLPPAMFAIQTFDEARRIAVNVGKLPGCWARPMPCQASPRVAAAAQPVSARRQSSPRAFRALRPQAAYGARQASFPKDFELVGDAPFGDLIGFRDWKIFSLRLMGREALRSGPSNRRALGRIPPPL